MAVNGHRIVDADGHVLEPPTGMAERAPARFRDRIWQIVVRPDGSEWFWASQTAWQCAESLKNNRATLAGLRADMTLPFDRRVKLPVDRLFDVNTLSRFGK